MEQIKRTGPEDTESSVNKSTNKSVVSPILQDLSGRKIYESLFDYLKSVTSELGEDTSFYTMDFGEVLWKYQLWRENLPRIQIFYAVKANPDFRLLKFLMILGASFDCASEGEIRAVLKTGCSPDKIIFANPNITSTGLKYAQRVGVDLLTFDSEEQLRRIHDIYANSRLLLRLKPQKVHCKFDFSEKFGCWLQEAEDLLKLAQNLKMNIVGVSFHVGSLNTGTNTFALTIKDSSRVFDIARSLGFRFQILDIGGGFIGSVGTDSRFKKIAATIQDALSTYFPQDDVEIIAEPGCYIVCSAVTLTTTIFSKRTIRSPKETSQEVKQIYFLNNGIYSSFARGIEEYNIYPVPLLCNFQSELQRPCYLSTFFGQSLCPMDVLKRDILFPDMKVGESIVWMNMGAYSKSICTTFCGFPLPEARYVFRINSSRLKTDWIPNIPELKNFLSKCTPILSGNNGTTNHYSQG